MIDKLVKYLYLIIEYFITIIILMILIKPYIKINITYKQLLLCVFIFFWCIKFYYLYLIFFSLGIIFGIITYDRKYKETPTYWIQEEWWSAKNIIQFPLYYSLFYVTIHLPFKHGSNWSWKQLNFFKNYKLENDLLVIKIIIILFFICLNLLFYIFTGIYFIIIQQIIFIITRFFIYIHCDKHELSILNFIIWFQNEDNKSIVKIYLKK